MKSVYLKLFRCELRRLEKKGGFRAVERYITTCEAYFQKREYQLVALLEKARLGFLMGRWDDCLALLDQVGSEESLLEPDDKALLYLVNAKLHQGYGDLNQSLTFLELALAEAEHGEGLTSIEANLEMAALFHRIGEHERGQEFLHETEALLKVKPDRRLASRLAFEKGLVGVRSERLEDAEDLFKLSLACLGKNDMGSIQRGEGLRFLGILACLDGRPVEGLKFQKQALECHQALPYRMGVAKTYNSLGQTCLKLGRYQEALYFLELAEQICREVGAEAERAMVFGKLGSVYTKLGLYEKAIAYQKKDLEISSSVGNYRALAFSLRNLGLSYKASGDLQKAVQYLRDSRDRFAELEDLAFQVKADLDLVAALLEHDRITEAFGFLEDAQELLDKRFDVTGDHVNARYFAGVIALDTENFHRAEQMLWQALEMAKALSLQTSQADIHYQLARLYVKKNDSVAAIEELRSSYRLARRLSLDRLTGKIVSQLHELDPEALFNELISPGF
ncbi:MAG TPA: tetratricopeptide repeat protein [Phycisphaerales bacterium]|nr:tetratricopeptide repeat protein [Phycisphaerales bacterium]